LNGYGSDISKGLIEEDSPAEMVDGAKDPRTRQFLEAVL
jgi:hypothetical protein